MPMEGAHNTKGYRRLLVWQKADALAYQVYEITRNFPEEERFGLISQMRRAGLSVPANIVEGYASSTNRARYRFYEIAKASLSELEYFIDFSYIRLKYINAAQFESLTALRAEVGRLLHGFMKSVR